MKNMHRISKKSRSVCHICKSCCFYPNLKSTKRFFYICVSYEFFTNIEFLRKPDSTFSQVTLIYESFMFTVIQNPKNLWSSLIFQNVNGFSFSTKLRIYKYIEWDMFIFMHSDTSRDFSNSINGNRRKHNKTNFIGWVLVFIKFEFFILHFYEPGTLIKLYIFKPKKKWRAVYWKKKQQKDEIILNRSENKMHCIWQY